MPAEFKITRASAALLLRDLPRYLAAAAKAGIAPPALEFKYGDALSRADAQELQTWGMAQANLVRALGDGFHPDHRAVNAFAALAKHFATAHPQAANGEPAPWTEPLSPGLAAFLRGDRDKIEAGELSPAEAQALIEYSFTRADRMAAYADETAADHEAAVAEIAALHDRAAEPGPAQQATPKEGAMAFDQTILARIAELNASLRDPNLFDRFEKRAELAKLLDQVPDSAAGDLAAALAGALAGSIRPTEAAKPATPANRVAELTARLRDTSLIPGSAERESVLGELATALEQGPPAPSDGAAR